METRQNEKTPLLEVRDLSVSFRMYDGSLEQRRGGGRGTRRMTG